MFCDVVRFMSSQILSQLLLIFFSSWSLTLIFLLMILLITHSQIALSVSGLKRCSNSFFYALEEQFNAINIDRFFLMFLDMLTVTQLHCKWFLVSFSPLYIHILLIFQNVASHSKSFLSVWFQIINWFQIRLCLCKATQWTSLYPDVFVLR